MEAGPSPVEGLGDLAAGAGFEAGLIGGIGAVGDLPGGTAQGHRFRLPPVVRALAEAQPAEARIRREGVHGRDVALGVLTRGRVKDLTRLRIHQAIAHQAHAALALLIPSQLVGDLLLEMAAIQFPVELRVEREGLLLQAREGNPLGFF